MHKSFLINQNWNFRVASDKLDAACYPLKTKSWQQAVVPGTIHTDLLKNNLIADPFYGDREENLKWICKIDWQYKTRFDLPSDFNPARSIYLVFTGLDTFTEIMLNNRRIGKTENMFRTYRWEVSKYLVLKNNRLAILFNNPFKVYEKIRKEKGDIFNSGWEPRVYLRKAQYSFGWDWGPAFPTMGIWRPVYLEQYSDVHIRSVRFFTKEVKDHRARLKIIVECEGDANCFNTIRIHLQNHLTHFEQVFQKSDDIPQQYEITIQDPVLWWPNGMGTANLYNLTVSLLDARQQELDVLQKKVGIRTVHLLLKDSGKPIFRFVVNNKPVFVKGANWIPADSFLPRIEMKTYQALLSRVKEAQMNILRVWGGGVYEDDRFYELCDELGLLVWQDFMFACAPYPEYPEFLQNIKEEIKENIVRLQHHPCLAIWCGNNENEWIWYRQGHRDMTAMPGYQIFHTIIPSMIKQLDPDRPYRPSSPFGDDKDPNDMLTGNRHQWDIWSFWIDYADVRFDKSLFVTEFGFQAAANRDTLEQVIPKKHRYVQGKIFEFHNKQVEGNERLFRFLSGHLPVRSGWDDYFYLTQLNQGFALKSCIEHWRERWPETGGSIIWQINDCWPVTSWSLIDSNLSPKMAYFFVRSVFSPNLILFSGTSENLKIRIFNQQHLKFTGRLSIVLCHDLTGKVESIYNRPIQLGADEFKDIPVPVLKSPDKDESTILVATLADEQNRQVNRNYFITGRWKHKTLTDPKIRFSIRNRQTIIRCSKPAFFVDFYQEGIMFSDRGFILLPGEEKIIGTGKPVLRSKVKIYTLNDYLKKK